MVDETHKERDRRYKDRRRRGERIVPVRVMPDDFARLQLLGC